jgi:hypothetical protein
MLLVQQIHRKFQRHAAVGVDDEVITNLATWICAHRLGSMPSSGKTACRVARIA